MKVIVVEPKREARVAEIDKSLQDMQRIVGGLIEVVCPWEDSVALVCNEEGKLMGLPYNRALKDEDGNIYDIIAGTFFIVGLSDDNFTDVPENLVTKYLELFRQPEFI